MAVYEYLSHDHNEMDSLLDRATAKPGEIDVDLYGQFRRKLLRHISIEEKLVLPTIARLQGGKSAAIAERLRLDHGALTALMVPSPTEDIIRTIRSILAVHNPLEEDEGGLYRLLDNLAGEEAEQLTQKMRSFPEVPVRPHNDRPGVLEAAQRAVGRAGHEFKSK